MVAMAHAALPVLLDRVGGRATVSVVQLAKLAERYRGAVAVKGEKVAPGEYRLTLVAAKPKSRPELPVS